MKQVLKYTGIILGIFIAALLFAILIIYQITESHLEETYELVSAPVEVSSDPDIIEYGKHVYTIRGCVDCHGENMEGKIFLENGMVGRFVAGNLTSGEGGIGTEYSDEDFVRSIRNGINKEGNPLIFMPSHEFNLINQRDMSAMISYIRSKAPVDHVLPESKVGLPIRALYLLGDVILFPARQIDHSVPIPADVPTTVLERGKYLSETCKGCHGANFSGGKIPGVPPEWPEASNLTPGDQLAEWTKADFFLAMREGITPDDRQLQKEYMPYPMLGQMTDEELEALYVYFQSLEPMESGGR